jgi:Aspartyl protease
MRIIGKWHEGDDGVKRPVVRVEVQGAGGSMEAERFLIDPGADRSAFRAGLLRKLGLLTLPAPADLALQGIGGKSGFVVVETIVTIRGDDGEATFRGQFAAFTDPAATEISILGREILNHFDVILSHRRDEVLLLAKEHTYRVVSA